MKNSIFISFSFCILISLLSCNLEKEVDIDLPEYTSEVVVECYLEPGQPYRLLLTRSAGYFDALPTSDDAVADILEEEATVTIEHKGNVVELANTFDFSFFITGKIANYVATEIVPADFDSDFNLEITTKDGRQITGTTRIMPFVPIDSLVVEFGPSPGDTMARVLTYFTDDTDTENYYRRMFHIGTLDSLEQEFALDDRFVDDGTVVFGTNYDYAQGDTLIASLFHITVDYHDYLNSVINSVFGNGNPFGQASTIVSNVKGDGIGIFTGFSLDRKQVIVEN